MMASLFEKQLADQAAADSSSGKTLHLTYRDFVCRCQGGCTGHLYAQHKLCTLQLH